jgi:hypothetical protein
MRFSTMKRVLDDQETQKDCMRQRDAFSNTFIADNAV